jgi:hypothetical protein
MKTFAILLFTLLIIECVSRATNVKGAPTSELGLSPHKRMTRLTCNYLLVEQTWLNKLKTFDKSNYLSKLFSIDKDKDKEPSETSVSFIEPNANYFKIVESSDCLDMTQFYKLVNDTHPSAYGNYIIYGIDLSSNGLSDQQLDLILSKHDLFSNRTFLRYLRYLNLSNNFLSIDDEHLLSILIEKLIVNLDVLLIDSNENLNVHNLARLVNSLAISKLKLLSMSGCNLNELIANSSQQMESNHVIMSKSAPIRLDYLGLGQNGLSDANLFILLNSLFKLDINEYFGSNITSDNSSKMASILPSVPSVKHKKSSSLTSDTRSRVHVERLNLAVNKLSRFETIKLLFMSSSNNSKSVNSSFSFWRLNLKNNSINRFDMNELATSWRPREPNSPKNSVEIDLSNNLIESLNEQNFKLLNASVTPASSVPTEAIELFRYVTIFLQGNPLLCDCNSNWLLDMVRREQSNIDDGGGSRNSRSQLQLKSTTRPAVVRLNGKSKNHSQHQQQQKLQWQRKRHPEEDSSSIKLIYKREIEEISSHHILNDSSMGNLMYRQKRIKSTINNSSQHGRTQNGEQPIEQDWSDAERQTTLRSYQWSVSALDGAFLFRIGDLLALKCKYHNFKFEPQRELLLNESDQAAHHLLYDYSSLNVSDDLSAIRISGSKSSSNISENNKQNVYANSRLRSGMRELLIADSAPVYYVCPYEDHCNLHECDCCSFRHCHCRSICPRACRCYYDTRMQKNIIDCSGRMLRQVPDDESAIEAATEMRLNDNKLATIKSHQFFGYGQLKYLYLESNELTDVDSEAFVDLRATLRLLNLADNSLTFLRIDAFNGLNELRILVLSNNPLRQIDLQRAIGPPTSTLTTTNALFFVPNLAYLFVINTRLSNISELVEFFDKHTNATVIDKLTKRAAISLTHTQNIMTDDKISSVTKEDPTQKDQILIDQTIDTAEETLVPRMNGAAVFTAASDDLDETLFKQVLNNNNNNNTMTIMPTKEISTSTRAAIIREEIDETSDRIMSLERETETTLLNDLTSISIRGDWKPITNKLDKTKANEEYELVSVKPGSNVNDAALSSYGGHEPIIDSTNTLFDNDLNIHGKYEAHLTSSTMSTTSTSGKRSSNVLLATTTKSSIQMLMNKSNKNYVEMKKNNSHAHNDNNVELNSSPSNSSVPIYKRFPFKYGPFTWFYFPLAVFFVCLVSSFTIVLIIVIVVKKYEASSSKQRQSSSSGLAGGGASGISSTSSGSVRFSQGRKLKLKQQQEQKQQQQSNGDKLTAMAGDAISSSEALCCAKKKNALNANNGAMKSVGIDNSLAVSCSLNYSSNLNNTLNDLSMVTGDYAGHYQEDYGNIRDDEYDDDDDDDDNEDDEEDDDEDEFDDDDEASSDECNSPKVSTLKKRSMLSRLLCNTNNINNSNSNNHNSSSYDSYDFYKMNMNISANANANANANSISNKHKINSDSDTMKRYSDTDMATVAVSRSIDSLSMNVFVYFSQTDSEYVQDYLIPCLKKCLTIIPDTKYILRPQSARYMTLKEAELSIMAVADAATTAHKNNSTTTNSTTSSEMMANSSTGSSSVSNGPATTIRITPNTLIANIFVLSEHFVGYKPAGDSIISIKLKSGCGSSMSAKSGRGGGGGKRTLLSGPKLTRDRSSRLAACLASSLKNPFKIHILNSDYANVSLYENSSSSRSAHNSHLLNKPNNTNNNSNNKNASFNKAGPALLMDSAKTHSLNQRLMRRLYDSTRTSMEKRNINNINNVNNLNSLNNNMNNNSFNLSHFAANDMYSADAFNEQLQFKLEKFLENVCLKSNTFSNTNFSYVDYSKR